MMTGVAAVRIGIVMFVIPFVFAFYPDILLIEAAFIDPTVTGTKTYLPGYDGTVDLGALGVLILRLLLALVLLASALARYDRAPLALWEVGARLVLAALLLAGDFTVYGAAAAAGLGLLAWHRVTTKPAAPQTAGS